ncbi:hypothetical protein BDV06DRAFT_226765 [Aspergillus oleicola]
MTTQEPNTANHEKPAESSNHQPVHLAWHEPMPHHQITSSIKISLGSLLHGSFQRPVKPYCIRGATPPGYKIETGTSSGFGFSVSVQRAVVPEAEPYVVVGVMGREGSIPKEIKMGLERRGDLFQQIRKAQRTLRPLLRRSLSLKTVVGFGLYECHPEQNRHSVPDIDRETELTLIQLFWDYKTSKYDIGDHWLAWVDSQLNRRENKYALRLVLRWSVTRFVIWGVTPLLLSLAIGFWYMYKPHTPDADPVAVVQTAWTLSSYIVTAAALAIGILAAVTQVGDV